MSDPTTPEGRAELRQMLEQATRSPWRTVPNLDGYHSVHAEPESEGAGFRSIAVDAETRYRIAVCDTPDAKLIAAAVNALPALLDALDRVRALADEWDTLPCVCGYRIPNGNDDSSQCLACTALTLRAVMDGAQ